jgi:hypothetical protein
MDYAFARDKYDKGEYTREQLEARLEAIAQTPDEELMKNSYREEMDQHYFDSWTKNTAISALNPTYLYAFPNAIPNATSNAGNTNTTTQNQTNNFYVTGDDPKTISATISSDLTRAGMRLDSGLAGVKIPEYHLPLREVR